MNKICKRCGKEFVGVEEIEKNFFKHPNTADKYRGICKKCWSEQTAENMRKKSHTVLYDRNYLRQLRKEAGLTMEEAAAIYGFKFSHYSYLEYKGKFIKKDEYKKILDYHGLKFEG